MTTRTVVPSVASGTCVAPPSKSYTHRALVAGFLSGRRSVIHHPLSADDTRATAAGLESLGCRITMDGDRWVLEPGENPLPRTGRLRIACGESGTTLRFLSVVAATLDRPVTLTGAGGLVRRPMSGLFRALQAGGVRFQGPAEGRSLPFTLKGPLQPLNSSIDTRTSSQFLSALLLVLPTLEGPSTLAFSGPPVSWTYVEATLAVMRAHGIRATVDRSGATLPGGQRYRGGAHPVPGDASSAAYAWAAAALTGGYVRVRGLPRRWPQADLAILPILSEMGAKVTPHLDGATVGGARIEGARIDLTASPDLYPLVGTIAAFAKGTTALTGAPHVIYKESDRKRATLLLARAFGARGKAVGPEVDIVGTSSPHGARLLSLDDHRVLMSAAVGAMAARGPSTLADARCVRKSFPTFWEWFGSIGMRTGRAT